MIEPLAEASEEMRVEIMSKSLYFEPAALGVVRLGVILERCSTLAVDRARCKAWPGNDSVRGQIASERGSDKHSTMHRIPGTRAPTRERYTAALLIERMNNRVSEPVTGTDGWPAGGDCSRSLRRTPKERGGLSLCSVPGGRGFGRSSAKQAKGPLTDPITSP